MKQNAAWLLEQELKKIRSGARDRAGNGDRSLPADRAAGADHARPAGGVRPALGYRLGIVTKSRLIERDIDLLVEIARRNHACGAHHNLQRLMQNWPVCWSRVRRVRIFASKR